MTLSVADIDTGGVLTTARGSQRTVIGLGTCGAVVEIVTYEITDRLGRTRWLNCAGETWRRNLAAEVKAGGSYQPTVVPQR